MSDTSNFNSNSEDDREISLFDIVEFIQQSWKQLLLVGLVGAGLGFVGWFFLGTYKTELVILNNTNTDTNTDTNTNTFGLDLLSWRILQRNLPNLANQIEKNDMLAHNQQEIYRAMSNSLWWSKNVIPAYAISKADVKDLAMISKDLDSAATKIQSFTIITSGNSKESSLNNARLASQFFKSGGAYLQVRALINSYQGDVLGTGSIIQNELTKTQIDQNYHKERIKALEELLRRFPNRANVNTQFLDPKERGSKYLPVENQLIAANNDLNQSKETIKRLNDRLIQIKMLDKFIALASPQIEAEFNGITLVKSLLTIEQDLRKGLEPSNLNSYQALDKLRSQLLTIEMRFTNGLQANAPTGPKKEGMLKSSAGGAAIAGFLTLAFLLGRRLLSNLKSPTVS